MKLKKLAVILLIFLLSLSVTTLFIQILEVKATTLTFSTSTSDGYVGQGITEYPYLTIRNYATGTVFDSTDDVIIGQNYPYSGLYIVYRGFLFFDTSSIPDGATIDSAILSLYVTSDNSTADFNVTVQDGQPTYPHNPLVNGDYYYQHYSGDGGSRNTSSISGTGYWNITLNSDGYDMISLTGATKLCLRSSEDIDASAPTGEELIEVAAAEDGASYIAKLYVEYSLPPSYSTLTVSSSPEINAQFSVNGTEYNTPSYVSASDNDIATLIAEEAKIYGGEGWLFDRWLVNGTDTYYDERIDLNITADTTLVIYYVEIPDLYHFYGPYDEETGELLDENVTVTVYYDVGGYPPYSHEFNGSWVYPSSPQAQHFQFNFSDGSTREYWVDPSETVLPIYIFWGDTTTYTINFLDTTGILNTYPYVTIKRYVNGTLYTIEKRKVDEYNSIIANLINTRTYQITLGSESQTYVFGDLTMTSTTSIQLVLRGVDFPKETLLLQKYIRVYGYRNGTSDPNTITIVYEDTKEQTVSVKIEINYANFTNVYTTTLYSDSFVFEWEDAIYGETYQVTVTITHETYGTLTWKQTFAQGFSEAPFSLAFLGDWTFDSSMLLPALIILLVAGSFSALNAYVGAILMSITAGVLAWWGWIPIPAGLIIAAFVLSVLMALEAKKRMGGITY